MIPEITKRQIGVMREVVFVPIFSQTEPMVTDSLANQIYLKEAGEDMAHLIELKLIKEITQDHLEQVTKTNAESGRLWHVYEVCPMGRAFFQADQSVLVH
jgi:hypothetical protein